MPNKHGKGCPPVVLERAHEIRDCSTPKRGAKLKLDDVRGQLAWGKVGLAPCLWECKPAKALGT